MVFSPKGGPTRCSTCQYGRFSNDPGTSEFIQCQVGRTVGGGSRKCIQCPYNTEAEEGAFACLNYTAGCSSPEDSSRCHLCHPGSGSSGLENNYTVCILLGCDGRSACKITAQKGSSDLSDCIPCDSGSFRQQPSFAMEHFMALRTLDVTTASLVGTRLFMDLPHAEIVLKALTDQ